MLRIAISVALGVVGIAFIAANFAGIIRYYLKGTLFSRAPLVGGALATCACLVYPGLHPGVLAYLPLVIDPGCLPLLASVLIHSVKSSQSPKA
jgi:hypothetical protein